MRYETMKPEKSTSLICLALICLLITAWTTQKSSTATQWEYKVSGKLDIKEEDLNQLGSQGWDLVAIDQRILNGSDYTVVYIFKRPRRQ